MELDKKLKKELASKELMNTYKRKMESQFDKTTVSVPYSLATTVSESVTELATISSLATTEPDIEGSDAPVEQTVKTFSDYQSEIEIVDKDEGVPFELATIPVMAELTTEIVPEILSSSLPTIFEKDLSISTADPALRLREVQEKVALERAIMFEETAILAPVEDTSNVDKSKKKAKKKKSRFISTTTVSSEMKELQMELEESKRKWRDLKNEKEMSDKKLKLASEIYMMAKDNTPDIIPIPEMPGYTATLSYPMATGTEILAPLGTVSETTKSRATVGLLDIHTEEGVAIIVGLALSGM